MAEGIGLTTDLSSLLRPSSYGTLRAWYDASQESFSEGGAVGTFTDRSGNGYHLTQATGSKKPLYKLNVANGRPALFFDGSDDTLATASFGATTQPTTIYVVAQRTGNTSAYRLLVDGIGASNRLAIDSEITTGKLIAYAGTELKSFEDVGSEWFVASVVFNGSSSKVQINDVVTASGAAGAQTLTGITLGSMYDGTLPWAGYIAEAIYFDGTVSTDNDYTIKRSLMAKYKIPYFDPADISGLRSKFMGDALRYRDSEGIALWEDPVSGYDLIQATAANQPLAMRDVLNHRTVARFDGSNDFLRSVAFAALSQPRTILVVAKSTSNAAIRLVLDGIASGNRHAIAFQITTGHTVIQAGTNLDSGVDAGLGWNIITAHFNGGSGIIRRNGTQENTGAVGAHTLTGYTLGAAYDNSFPLIGDVYALLNYDGALTTVQMQRIEGWLKALTAL